MRPLQFLFDKNLEIAQSHPRRLTGVPLFKFSDSIFDATANNIDRYPPVFPLLDEVVVGGRKSQPGIFKGKKKPLNGDKIIWVFKVHEIIGIMRLNVFSKCKSSYYYTGH